MSYQLDTIIYGNSLHQQLPRRSYAIYKCTNTQIYKNTCGDLAGADPGRGGERGGAARAVFISAAVAVVAALAGPAHARELVGDQGRQRSRTKRTVSYFPAPPVLILRQTRTDTMGTCSLHVLIGAKPSIQQRQRYALHLRRLSSRGGVVGIRLARGGSRRTPLSRCN